MPPPYGERAYDYCRTDQTFLRLFEGFLYQLVQHGEITERFDSLTKMTAFKIEKFIKELIQNHQQLLDSDNRVKQSLKDFDTEFKKSVKEMHERQAKRRQEMSALIAELEE